MHPNQKTLENFYTAFAALDADTMAACYADNAEFQDAVFTLHGKPEVAGMWHMLCGGVHAKGRKDWKLVFNGVQKNLSALPLIYRQSWPLASAHSFLLQSEIGLSPIAER